MKKKVIWTMRILKSVLVVLPISILVFWCYTINPNLSGYEYIISIVVGLVMQYITRFSTIIEVVGTMIKKAEGNDLNHSFKSEFAKLMKKINEENQ